MQFTVLQHACNTHDAMLVMFMQAFWEELGNDLIVEPSYHLLIALQLTLAFLQLGLETADLILQLRKFHHAYLCHRYACLTIQDMLVSKICT